MDLLKKNKVWIGIGACVLAILGNFLPFYNIILLGTKESGKNLVSINGVYAVIAFAVAAVLIYLKKNNKLILGLLAIGLGITIYCGLNLSKIVNIVYGSVRVSVGFYVIIAGGAIAAAIQFINVEKNNLVNNLSDQGFVSYNTQPTNNQPQLNNQQLGNQYQNSMNHPQYNNQYQQQGNQGYEKQYNNQPQLNNQQLGNQYQNSMNHSQYNNQYQQQGNQGYGQQYNNQPMRNQNNGQYPNQNNYPYQ